MSLIFCYICFHVCTSAHLCRHVEPAQAVCGKLLPHAGRVALRLRLPSDSGCVRPPGTTGQPLYVFPCALAWQDAQLRPSTAPSCRDRALLLLYRGLAVCTSLFFILFLLLALPPPSALDPLTIRAVRPDPGDAAEVSAVAERVDAQRHLLLSISGPAAPAIVLDTQEQGTDQRKALQASWVGFAVQTHGDASAPGADAGARADVQHSPHLHGPAADGASQSVGRDDLGYRELPASRGLQQAALKRLRDDAAEQVRPDGAGHDQGRTRKKRDRRPDRRSARSVRGRDHTLSKAQRAVRAAFYLWLGAANLVRPSTLEPCPQRRRALPGAGCCQHGGSAFRQRLQ